MCRTKRADAPELERELIAELKPLANIVFAATTREEREIKDLDELVKVLIEDGIDERLAYEITDEWIADVIEAHDTERRLLETDADLPF